MATEAQINANRLNAQKSTGPRSAEGRAVSRFNALKHAATAKSLVIPGEDPEALAELTASYEDKYQPVGPEEELLVEKIVTADWTQRRMRRVQGEVLRVLMAQQDAAKEDAAGVAVIQDSAGSNVLQKIFRCREAASREWYRARKELLDLQALRFALDPLAPIEGPQPSKIDPLTVDRDPQIAQSSPLPAAAQPSKTEPLSVAGAIPVVDPGPQPPVAHNAQSGSVTLPAPPASQKLGSFFDESTPKA